MNEAEIPLTADAMHHVQSIVPAATVKEAALKLREAGVDLLPVMVGERLLGSISVWELALRGPSPRADPSGTSVASLMTTEPSICGADMPAAEAVDWMVGCGLSAALVQDRGGHVVGALSLIGLLSILRDRAADGPIPDYVYRVRGESH